MSESFFILARRDTYRQLLAKFLGESPFETECGLVIDSIVLFMETFGVAEFFLRQALHPDEESAAIPFSAVPCFHRIGECLPAAEVKVADTKVGVRGGF